MTNHAKRKITAFLLLAMIVLILIAAALPQLELKPGTPLPSWVNGTGRPPVEEAPTESISVNTFLKAVLAIIAVLILAYSVYKFLAGVSWKEILGPALMIAVLAAAALFILFAVFTVRISPASLEPTRPPPIPTTDGPPLGAPPASLIWLVWIGLAVGVSLLVIWANNRRTQNLRASDPLELEAERAMQALRTGLDFKNVILHCYEQMSLALQKEQGIELKETMTAREFERLLETRGIPRAPVQQLTQLFEAARYSLQQFTPADEQQAFDCLSAIVQYCRERKPDRP